MKNKRVFVSGGAGVIGKELVSRLHKKGAIILVGDLKPRPANWPTEIIYRQGDLNYITKEEIELFKPEIFIHLAATSERSTETYDFWEENFWHNVRLSNNLMSLLKDLPMLERVIFASSYLIYDPKLYSFPQPQKKSYCLKESDPINPRNLTGGAKLQHEVELNFLNEFKSEQYTTVCARIFRGYGKGSRCVISRWIRDLLDKKPIEVYKKEGKFDFIYAEETANGLIKLIEHPEITDIINLGNGKSRAISEVINILKKYFPDMEIKEYDKNIPFEASRADMSQFNNITDWVPKKQLEDAIPEMIDYEKNRSRNTFSYSNVLITSISKKVPLIEQVKQSTNKMSDPIRTIGVDIDNSCIGRHFVDEFLESPKSKELSKEFILKFCKKHNVNSIIPTRDGELIFFAEIRGDLGKNGINTMISDIDTVKWCLDKLHFYTESKETNIPIIPTYENLDNFDDDYYYVVKERYGSGSKTVGLKLTKEQSLEYAEKLNNPIFQPFIDGFELSVDAYIDLQGNIKGIVPRKREKIVNGESQITTSVTIPEVNNIVNKLLAPRNFYGHVIIQILLDNNENGHIIECNPRFGGASSLSIKSGLDSFYWFLLESYGVDISSYPFIRPETELRQIRYPKDIIQFVK